MVFCVNKNSVHVAVPARHVSVKSFTFQVWANPETWSDRPGYQRESGWPVLISKSQSWFDGFGAYGSPDQTLYAFPTPNLSGVLPHCSALRETEVVASRHVYVGEWNKNLASTRLELGKWQCVTATFNFSLEGGVLSLYVDGVLKVLPLCLARAVLSAMRVCCVLSACGAMRGAMRGADGACRTRKARKEGLPPTRGNDAVSTLLHTHAHTISLFYSLTHTYTEELKSTHALAHTRTTRPSCLSWCYATCGSAQGMVLCHTRYGSRMVICGAWYSELSCYTYLLCDVRYWPKLSCYAFPMRCPVLT
eukprot:1652884-Rhodomonas_salina.2